MSKKGAKTDLETTRECIAVRAWLPCEGVDESQRCSRRQGPSRVAPVGPWSSHPLLLALVASWVRQEY